jgi:putative ABC transport system permease protein
VPERPSAADLARITAALRAQPGTRSFYGRTNLDLTVEGVQGTVPAQLYSGASRGVAYEMIAGHWFTGPGQVVAPTRFLTVTGKRIGDVVTVADGRTRVPLRIVGEAFDPGDDGMTLDADAASLPAGAVPDTYGVELRHGTDADAYIVRLNAALRSAGAEAVRDEDDGGSLLLVIESMAATLTLLLVAVAGLGVLNSVVLDTRERVHDLGVCKAVGMSPRQTMTMVLASVAGLGVVGGLIGVPLGMAVHGYVLPRMGEGAGTGLTPQIVAVYHGAELVLLGLAGVAIALLGAALPAGWAARARTATALRTE